MHTHQVGLQNPFHFLTIASRRSQWGQIKGIHRAQKTVVRVAVKAPSKVGVFP